MLSKWFAIVFLAAPLCAQFQEAATNGDGSQVYLVTELRLGDPAVAAPPELRVYHWDGAPALFAERGDLARKNAGGSGDGVRGVTVSSDGQSVAFSMYDVCPPGDPCNRTIVQAQVRTGDSTTVLGEGTVLLSRNRRWAVLSPPFRLPVPGSAQPATVLIDLVSGERTEVPALAGTAIPPASDGTLVVRQGTPPAASSLGLWRNGSFTPLGIAGTTGPLALSADQRVLIFTRVAGTAVQLVARDLASSGETVVSASGLPWVMGLSDDGRWLLYRATTTSAAGTARLADTASGASVDLPLDQELATGGTLSGLGNAAILLTASGRVVRVSLVSGQPAGSETLVPATPWVDGSGFSPGSMVRLQGSLPRDAEALRGHLRLDDVAMPILSVSESEIQAQVPWEVAFQAAFLVDLPSDSPFRQRDLVFIPPVEPRFEPYFRFIKEDFSSILDRPPQPGEIVNVYMTGLGRVDGAIATGEAAPLDRLLPIQGKFVCRFSPQPAAAETLFAGLAPGMTGIYQVTFRMPPGAGAPINGGRCDTGSGSLVFSSLTGEQAPGR